MIACNLKINLLNNLFLFLSFINKEIFKENREKKKDDSTKI